MLVTLSSWVIFPSSCQTFLTSTIDISCMNERQVVTKTFGFVLWDPPWSRKVLDWQTNRLVPSIIANTVLWTTVWCYLISVFRLFRGFFWHHGRYHSALQGDFCSSCNNSYKLFRTYLESWICSEWWQFFESRLPFSVIPRFYNKYKNVSNIKLTSVYS